MTDAMPADQANGTKQRPILFRFPRFRAPLQTEEPLRPGGPRNILRVNLSVRYESTWKRAPDGIGSVRAGFDKSALHVTTGVYGTTVRTAEDVKRVIRRLRPQEAVELDMLDEQIRVLQQRRRDVANQAWAKAHVVTLSELREVAEEWASSGE
jgi:hypothetical protein